MNTSVNVERSSKRLNRGTHAAKNAKNIALSTQPKKLEFRQGMARCPAASLSVGYEETAKKRPSLPSTQFVVPIDPTAIVTTMDDP